METIKTLQTIGDADIRRTLRVIINQTRGEERRFAFTDIEQRVADIYIPPSAPEDVRDLFVTAKNLLLYSWFYYPFSVTASLQASIAVERALKIRLNAKPRDMLGKMLKQAVDQGLLKDEGFPRWKAYTEKFRVLHQLPAPDASPKLTDILLETFPPFRNTIAHGTPFLDDMGFHQLDIAVEVVAQLFAAITDPLASSVSP